MNEQDSRQKAGIRRTTLILVGVALAFYLGFIALGLLR